MHVFPPTTPAALSVTATGDPLALRTAERVARMVSDLRLGLPVVLLGEPAAALILPVETLSPERFAALGSGGELVLTARPGGRPAPSSPRG